MGAVLTAGGDSLSGPGAEVGGQGQAGIGAFRVVELPMFPHPL